MLIKRYIGREVGDTHLLIVTIFSRFTNYLRPPLSFHFCGIHCKQALWLHRRFLSLFWIKHFLTDHTGLSSRGEQKTSMNDDFSVFMDNELHLLHSCSIIPDNSFDDYQAQAMHSATYMLWLIKVMEIFLHMQFVMTSHSTL